MWEIIKNIGYWLVSNWKGIVIFFTSGTGLALIAQILSFRKTNKELELNTNATKKLNETVVEITDTKQKVEDMKKSNEMLTLEVTNLKSQLAEQENTIKENGAMLTSILNVMQVVYSTVKDETIRKTVNNIITEAKYAAMSTKVELEKQVEELKAQLEEGAEKLKEQAIAKLETVKTTVSKKSKQTSSTRY